MNILIKGMEMPTRCVECRLSTVNSFNDRPLCDVLVEYMSFCEWETKRLDDCPLVPVPPHGRLIDADAMIEDCHAHNSQRSLWGELEYLIDNAPTIIPAEEVDHDDA